MDGFSKMQCTVGLHSVNARVERRNEEGVNMKKMKIGVEEQRKGHYWQSNLDRMMTRIVVDAHC